MDDHGRYSGDSAGTTAHGSTGWWPLCHFRLERSVPAGYQPEQPVEAPVGAGSPGYYRTERKRMLQEAVDALFDNGRRADR